MEKPLADRGNERVRRCSVVGYVFLISCVAAALFPIVWVILSSFKSNGEILSNGLALPDGFLLSGYIQVFRTSPILRYFCNSVVVAAVSTALNVLFLSMSAYVFARFSFFGKKALHTMLVLSLMVPMTALLHPVSSIVNFLGLYDTKAGLILVYIALNLPMSLLILYSAFRAIPDSLEEAACLDGAGFVRTFFQIMLPCAKNGLITAAVLAFLNCWNEFTFALVLTSGQSARTLPLSLSYFTAQYTYNYTALFAAVTIAVLPSVAVFALFQEQINVNFSAGSVKE